uniref:Uncharacterized protein n=1 Tax=Lepeophtheirus salmonis TaxID=72036 RepID=A0A0K2T1B1_LEPSM
MVSVLYILAYNTSCVIEDENHGSSVWSETILLNCSGSEIRLPFNNIYKGLMLATEIY